MQRYSSECHTHSNQLPTTIQPFATAQLFLVTAQQLNSSVAIQANSFLAILHTGETVTSLLTQAIY